MLNATRFRTATINVKSNPEMRQGAVRHDVHRAAHSAGLIGWQEIAPRRYFEAIKQLGPKWSHYMPRDGGLHIPVPISWKNDVWKKEDAGFIRTHHGKAGISPNRYITWVKLKNRATGKEIVRVNTHLVSGAWGGPRPQKDWRQDMWRLHMTKLDGLVDHFEKQGLTVVVGGDFNRDSFHVMGKQMRYDNNLHVGTHGRSTFDYVMHSRDEHLKRLGGFVQGGYASDHDAVVVRYKLR
jgi:hypothetical protein